MYFNFKWNLEHANTTAMQNFAMRKERFAKDEIIILWRSFISKMYIMSVLKGSWLIFSFSNLQICTKSPNLPADQRIDKIVTRGAKTNQFCQFHVSSVKYAFIEEIKVIEDIIRTDVVVNREENFCFIWAIKFCIVLWSVFAVMFYLCGYCGNNMRVCKVSGDGELKHQ